MRENHEQRQIINSVVDSFRDGVCIVDRGERGFTAYGVDPDSKVSIKASDLARMRHAGRP